MSIQSTINQGMSVAALLFSQSDFAKETRDIRMAEKNINKLSTISNEASEGIKAYVTGDPELIHEGVDVKADVPELGIKARAQEDIAGEREKIARLRPTSENIASHIKAQENIGEGTLADAYHNPEKYTFRTVDGKMSWRMKQDTAKTAANDALAAEAERIAATPSFDLSKLAEGPRARVERAYQRAERDTYYLNKNKKEDTK